MYPRITRLLTLGGWLATLSVVILNGPHAAVCRLPANPAVVVALDNATLGWPWMFRGHLNETMWHQPAVGNRAMLIGWNYHHLRPLHLFLDVAFAVSFVAAVEALSRRMGTRYSLRTLLAWLTFAAVLMGIAVRWDWRAAATVLAGGIIVAAVVTGATKHGGS